MNKVLQFRRGTTTQHSTFSGANGEISIDTTKYTAVVHDGSTLGGFPLATEAALNTKATSSTTLAGYGITDAYTQTQIDSSLSLKADLSSVYTQSAANALFATISTTYTQTQTDSLLSGKASIYNIGTVEYLTGNTRGGAPVFGLQVNIGTLPSSTTSVIAIPGYASTFTYWIDASNSYMTDGTTTLSLPYTDTVAGNSVSVSLGGGNITVTTASANYTAYSGYLVLLYTK